MARVCDMAGCDRPAAERVDHPTRDGAVDVCDGCRRLFPDDATETDYDSTDTTASPEPENPGRISDY